MVKLVDDDLEVLVYVSTATHLLSAAEIDHLLRKARQRNAEQHVTGVLLYDRGNFIQYLEGPSAGISFVYDCIVRDTLHQGVVELIREPISTREFGEWFMAFRSISLQGLTEVIDEDHRLTERLTQPSVPISPERMLLLKFWHRGRLRVLD
jgi:hypothetical protein